LPNSSAGEFAEASSESTAAHECLRCKGESLSRWAMPSHISRKETCHDRNPDPAPRPDRSRRAE
jgi:hypothetical protein